MNLRLNEFEDQAWRPLTFAERKVNLKLIKDRMAKAEKDLGDETGKTNKATLEQIMLAKQLEDELNNQVTTLEKTLETFKKLNPLWEIDDKEKK